MAGQILDESYMRVALDMGRRAKQKGDVPFGAVIVYRDEIIAAVENSEHLDHDVTKHAEVKAVALASEKLRTRNLSDCVIYSSVEPCPMCAGAIFHSCITRVVFGMSRDDLPHLFRTRNIRLWDLADDWHYKPEIVGGVLREEVIDEFLDYKDAFRVTPRVAVGLA